MASRVLNLLLVVLLSIFVVNHLYKQPSYNAGELAPDFTTSTFDGNSFSLSSLRGSYVLLDFWGSWCGPCRKENKELVNLYNEFVANRVDTSVPVHFVSVAIESNEHSFEKAVKEDGLIWPYHILQLDRFSSEIVKLYGIKSIPTKFLIDPDGFIIKTNPSSSEIRQILSEKVFGS